MIRRPPRPPLFPYTPLSRSIEFDWRADIRYARQVVMERLATVPMPEGIRPQMTPPASIMGQILHVGLHRRNGPRGGELAAAGKDRKSTRLNSSHSQISYAVF